MTRPRAEIKLGTEWRDLIDAIDAPKFEARLYRGARIASERVGQYFQREARRAIRRRDYVRNSPITVIMKGSSTPLVDGGDLFQGLTYEVPEPFNVRLGVMRRKVGDKAINVAAILHEGATIDVGKHPQVRRAVFAKLRDQLSADRLAALNPRSRGAVRKAAGQLGMGGKRSKLTEKQRKYLMAKARQEGRLSSAPGRGKQVWVIPARRFILDPIAAPGFAEFVVDQYGQAVRAALGLRRRR